MDAFGSLPGGLLGAAIGPKPTGLLTWQDVATFTAALPAGDPGKAGKSLDNGRTGLIR